jgi:DNA-binding transcriptional LysR family regulator
MELRHLRYFIAAAEESTLGAAAKRLRISQPALTRQIHEFERDIGVDVFARGARGIALTPAGEVCLVSARHILHQVDVAIERARGAARGTIGLCRLSVGARSLSSGLLARILTRAHAEYPGIEIVVREGMGPQQWKTLETNEVDIGLGLPMPAEHDYLVAEPFDDDMFDAILVAKSHPLASRTSVSLDDLRRETFLAWEPQLSPEFDQRLRAAFKRAGFKPAVRRDCKHVPAVTALARAGQGWALIPSELDGFATGDMAVIPLTDFTIPLAHAILTRTGEARPVVQTIVNLIRRIGAEDRMARGHAPFSTSVVQREGAPVDDPPAGKAASIELRHLRYYCAVVNAQSFGRAAERLELTQPALSRQIRDLERAVGIDLLERAARGATTTPGGDSFHDSARHILAEAEALPAEAQRARRGMQSRCVLASVPSIDAQMLVTELLRRCAAEMPDLVFSLEDCTTAEQPVELRAARIDLGVCHSSPLSTVELQGVKRERLLNDVMNCALVQANSDLAFRHELSLSDFADVPFVFVARAIQPGLYDEVFSAFEGQGFRPRVDFTYVGLKTTWTMVAEGRGWAIGFESQRAHPPNGTVAVPIHGFALPWGVDVMLATDESRAQVLLLVDMLHDIARAHERRSQTN